MKNFFSFIFWTLTGLFILLQHPLWGQKKILTSNGQTFEHVSRSHPNPPPSVSACPDEPFRSVDGTCNNISRQSRIEWGATDIQLYRKMLPMYGSLDHYNAMGGEDRPSPRAISNALCTESTPTENSHNLSSFVFTWGQFLDHDITLTPEGHTEYEPIALPPNEPLFTSDIPFFRSEVYDSTGSGNYRQQTNLITSYIDGSNVYGSDQDRADWLRTFQGGKLKTSQGQLLPFNTISGEYADAIDPNAPSMAGDNGGTVKTFVAGDIRAAEQPGLTALHTLFVREHNRICDRLARQGINDDETAYQVARKEIGAIIQAITYNEFLPALGMRIDINGRYNDRIQSDISNLFATAAYRLGHTMVTDRLFLLDDDCEPVNGGEVSLLEGFFNPSVVIDNQIAPILKGLSAQKQNEIDLKMIDNLRNFLFGASGVGLDLASLNIQRGRDHGLPDYNSIRRHYTGRGARGFDDITRDRNTQRILRNLYDDVNNIDAWIGLLAEDKDRRDVLPPTLRAILMEQFTRLRDGDRYFFTHDRHLPRRDVDRINRITLAEVILSNTALTDLQRNVFIVEECQQVSTLRTQTEEEVDANGLRVYPNPTSGNITIETPLAQGELQIINLQGDVLRQIQITDVYSKLTLDHLPPASYLVIYRNENIIQQQRIILLDAQ